MTRKEAARTDIAGAYSNRGTDLLDSAGSTCALEIGRLYGSNSCMNLRQNGARERVPWIVRIGRAHVRLWMSAAFGTAVGAILALSTRLGPVTCALAGWDAGVAFYLAAVAVMMARSPATEIRRHAAAQDEGAFAILLLAAAAALASLGAIFAELAGIKPSTPGFVLYVALAIATVILSWTFTHTIFALHCASPRRRTRRHSGGTQRA